MHANKLAVTEHCVWQTWEPVTTGVSVRCTTTRARDLRSSTDFWTGSCSCWTSNRAVTKDTTSRRQRVGHKRRHVSFLWSVCAPVLWALGVIRKYLVQWLIFNSVYVLAVGQQKYNQNRKCTVFWWDFLFFYWVIFIVFLILFEV